MATIKFFIQSKNNPAGIYVRLREGRTIDAKAKTKFAINPTQWSSSKGQPKNLKDESYKKLDQDLIKLKSDLLNSYNSAVSTESINSVWLKNFISPPTTVNETPTKLVDYFDFYAEQTKTLLKASSTTKLNVNKHLIERFQRATGREYFVKDVNNDFKLKFEAYCQSQEYAPNTIARTIKFIKTICYHARGNGIETHNQLNGIRTKIDSVKKIYLTPEEIDKIETKYLEQEALINARDWLIISCETGQRVSDFMRFSKDQIRIQDGIPLIEFKQVKTGKQMAVFLSPRVRGILAKRNGDFPRKISDQRYNEHIKEVCRIAGISTVVSGAKRDKEKNRKKDGEFPKHELVTSHIGRRSFATNNYGRIPTPLLMNITGHSTESMFLEYIGKTNTDLAIQAANYFK